MRARTILANRLLSRRLAFSVPFALFAVVSFIIVAGANRDIEQALDQERDAATAAFCMKQGMAPGTGAQSSCKIDLLELLNKDEQRRAASGLF